jgi:hypothetical protein
LGSIPIARSRFSPFGIQYSRTLAFLEHFLSEEERQWAQELLIPPSACPPCGIAASQANSLCRGREKRTMHRLSAKIGNSS